MEPSRLLFWNFIFLPWKKKEKETSVYVRECRVCVFRHLFDEDLFMEFARHTAHYITEGGYSKSKPFLDSTISSKVFLNWCSGREWCCSLREVATSPLDIRIGSQLNCYPTTTQNWNSHSLPVLAYKHGRMWIELTGYKHGANRERTLNRASLQAGQRFLRCTHERDGHLITPITS